MWGLEFVVQMHWLNLASIRNINFSKNHNFQTCFYDILLYFTLFTQIGFVNAGVSVLNSASHILLNKRIRKLETHWDKRIKDLTKTNAKFKRCKFFFIDSYYLIWRVIDYWVIPTPLLGVGRGRVSRV